ncbi:Hsp70 family protein [Arthrobacter sp. Rue61a]|uniref:Hsp70 family protein n=1 Tax=Arthrobacter sp. Rue61a TaxID=1118963 RepID=UPI00027DF4FC|nr:Hsp70 family protein [Arthrobacter sp. Rue61a]AFR30305.1 chaperone protein DnaK [Arthrobacter sp. Rue61a]
MSYVLAIDVGTSFTAAALVKPQQGPAPTPEILSLGLHGSAVPSVLFYADDGRILVGEAAERRGLDDPQRMVREFKRRIGDSVPLAVGESWLAPEDVYATMARWVVDKAEEREGSAPSSIIMTYPAAWGQHRTSLVLAALNMAGLQDITLISEPEAAALHYASQKRVEDGSIIAVYDLGGGTFDTAVLRKAGAGNFELLGRPDGIETLGGADFDAAVLRHVMGHVGDAAVMDPGSPGTLAALSRLRRECREAKEALSLDSEASVAVSLPGTQLSVRLVRSEFEAMIEAPVRDTVDALERSLGSINLGAQDLSAVLLIGGSSRIPLVAELISVELDRPIAVDADPKSSICLGAAVAGLRSSGAGAVDAAAGAPTLASASKDSVAGGRPHVPGRVPAFSHPKAASAKPGRHAPRPRVRMAAAAAAAATALTIATATAAQSPEGTGLLATVFGNQAADVMRDGGAQASGAQASGAQGGSAAGGAAGSAPVMGGPAAGLEASAKAGVTRAGSNGRAPVRQGTTNSGAANAGTGSASTGSGNTAGAGAGGTTAGTVAGGTGGTTAPAAPGTGTTVPGTQAPGTQTPGTQTPGTQTPPTTPAPDPTGGAASGPTPDPSTPPPTTPPVVVEPTTPPVIEPTTPPTTPAEPVTPPPSPEPPAPQPEPTVVQDPPPPSPEPTLPQETAPPVTPDPAPSPAETSPTPDPALLSAV